jgi:hypothetical protein
VSSGDSTSWNPQPATCPANRFVSSSQRGALLRHAAAQRLSVNLGLGTRKPALQPASRHPHIAIHDPGPPLSKPRDGIGSVSRPPFGRPRRLVRGIRSPKAPRHLVPQPGEPGAKRRPVAGRPPRRAEAGLPDEGGTRCPEGGAVSSKLVTPSRFAKRTPLPSELSCGCVPERLGVLRHRSRRVSSVESEPSSGKPGMGSSSMVEHCFLESELSSGKPESSSSSCWSSFMSPLPSHEIEPENRIES